MKHNAYCKKQGVVGCKTIFSRMGQVSGRAAFYAIAGCLFFLIAAAFGQTRLTKTVFPKLQERPATTRPGL